MTTTLDLEKAAPRYARISGILADEIQRLYKPGDKLPPEQVLANRFAVNRHTLRRAVEELVKAGLVERRWGVGVFVLEPFGGELQAAGGRVTEDLLQLGVGAQTEVIARQTVPASAQVAAMLGLTDGAPVTRVASIGRIDAQPVLVSSHCLEAIKFDALLEDYRQGDFSRFLRRQAGIQLTLARSLISAEFPVSEDARHLAISSRRPILHVQCLYRESADTRPTAFSQTRFRADRLQIGISH